MKKKKRASKEDIVANTLLVKERITNALEFICTYAGHVDEWDVIRKELLLALPPSDRKLFRSHVPDTNEKYISDFEKLIIAHWAKLTGRSPIY